MRLFNPDANFDFALDIILILKRFYLAILPKTYVDAVNRLKSEREKIAAEHQELIDTLKDRGFSEEEVKKIIEEYRESKILSAFGVQISREDDSKFLEEIKLDVKNTLFGELQRTRENLQICEDILRRVEEIEALGKTGEVERVFSEIASLEILVKSNSEDIKKIKDLVKILCREIDDHTLLPFIKMLGLECLSILDAVKTLDFLVSKKLIDSENLLESASDTYLPWSDFIVFIFLLAHVQKILSYEELLEEIDLYRWKKNWENWKPFYRIQEREPLLNLSKMLIIPLSLGNRTHARLALALATLVVHNREHRYDLNSLENLCRGLMNIGKYGEDELIGKLLIYSYFYGDLGAIMMVGELAGIKRSLKEALNELKNL